MTRAGRWTQGRRAGGVLTGRVGPTGLGFLTGGVVGLLLTTTGALHAQFIPRPAPIDTTRVVPDSLAEDTTVYELAALRVRATRPLATQTGATAIRLNMDAPRVAAAPILDEALRKMPFFQVRENSRGEAQLTLRGTESRQVAVLVDGIPLTLGWDARTDLSLIPVGAAREIQLYRGLSSVLHGPNVLGGVVEINILRGSTAMTDPPPFRAQAGIDDTGATAIAAEVGERFRAGAEDVTVRAGIAYRKRDGLALASGVSQPRESDDDLRLNSDRQHVNGFLAARYGSPEGGPWIALSSFAFEADKGVPPELHIESPRLWRIPETSRVVTALSGGTGWGATPLGEGDLEASFGVDWGDSRIDEFETLAYETVRQRELSDDRTMTARLVGDHTLARGTVRAAFTFADTRHIETLDPGESSRFRQQLWSLAAEAEQPIGGTDDGGLLRALTLTAGLSLDRASTPETGGREPRDPLVDWGARVGASALIAGGTTRLHAGVSRRVRFPSLRELYSGALGRFVPNPALAPEVLVVGELGATVELADLDGQVVLFHQRWSDAIVRSSVGDGMFRRENRNRVTATGVELLASVRLGPALLGGDLTLQGVALRDELVPQTEREPEYQPEVFGSLEVTGPLALGVWGTASVGYVGPQYCVNPELEADQRLGASGRLGLLVGREWRLGGPLSSLETSLALDNVTDATVFDQCGLPQPGRTLRLQVRLR